MADEDKDSKTEEATPRRLEEARADGQVAMSTAFVAGVMLAATVGAILVVGSGLVEAAGLLEVGEQRDGALQLRQLPGVDRREAAVVERGGEGVVLEARDRQWREAPDAASQVVLSVLVALVPRDEERKAGVRREGWIRALSLVEVRREDVEAVEAVHLLRHVPRPPGRRTGPCASGCRSGAAAARPRLH